MSDATPQEESNLRGDGELPPLPSALALISLGTSIAACVGLGLWLGILADGALHSSPACMVVGLLLGVAAAVASTVAQVRRYR